MNLTSPKNWKTVPAEEFCIKVADGTHDSPKQSEEGRFLVTSKNIKNGILDISSSYKISEEDFNEINKRSKVDQWDVLFSMIGTVGETCVIREDPDFAIKNVGLFKCGNKERALFLYYFLSSKQGREIALGLLNGTTQKYITLGELRKFPISVPESFDEQKEIALILGSLDDKIELLRRENKTLESIAQAMFREWFVDFKFPGYEKVKVVDGVPEGWKIGNIYDLMKIQYGFPFKSEFFNENRNGLPLIRIRDLKDGNPSIYTNEVCGEEYIIKRGDIIAGMDAEFRPCIWKGENGVLNQRVCKFISKDESISNYFIYQVIKPHLEFFERTKGGTTVSHLGKADLDSIELLIPPKNILVSFSDAIDSSHKKLVNNFSEIQTLSRLRDDLLNKIFNV